MSASGKLAAAASARATGNYPMDSCFLARFIAPLASGGQLLRREES